MDGGWKNADREKMKLKKEKCKWEMKKLKNYKSGAVKP